MPEATNPTEPTSPEAKLYAELKAATIAMRDSELATLAAQDRHRKALAAWMRHVAPVGQQRG